METVNTTDKYFKVFKIENKNALRKVSKAELKRRWRILVMKAHSDKGGNDGAFRFVNEAYHYLLDILEDFLKREDEKFKNPDLIFYGDGSVYDKKKCRWVKLKGQRLNVKS